MWEHKIVAVEEVMKLTISKSYFLTKKVQEVVTGYEIDGWELISMIPTMGSEYTTQIVLAFKRPKQ